MLLMFVANLQGWKERERKKEKNREEERKRIVGDDKSVAFTVPPHSYRQTLYM